MPLALAGIDGWFASLRPCTNPRIPEPIALHLTLPAPAAAGGKRRVTVPPSRGFGADGGVLRPTEHVPDKDGVIPPDATLEYELELQRVSIPPS